ncbi:MAG: class I SAM-dependent methyltransferase [Planctomycetaceae bacterium]|jgi:SAM-dependent methyltransferase|nr:class I SAM-dependent methyltransferase [Planctomycetaceae bacterium]
MKELASNKEWKKWGESDPLFGVASWNNKNKDGSNPWTNEDFYQLGESDWRDFRTHWERYGLSSNDSCLEIGCGAGRITKQLALYFKEVHAVDVSEKMIEYAKTHVTSSSVSFHVSTGVNIPLNDQSVNSVFSTHVFQHLDTLDIARNYFKEISRVLKRNGTMMIHLPIYKWPSSSRGFKQLYAIRKQLSDVRASMRRSLMEFGLGKPIMRGLWYPVDFFYEEFPKLGLDDIEISMFVTKSNNDPHPFVLARKG